MLIIEGIYYLRFKMGTHIVYFKLRGTIIFVNVWRKDIFDIYVTEYDTALTTILPILLLYLNTVTVTAGTFEP